MGAAAPARARPAGPTPRSDSARNPASSRAAGRARDAARATPAALTSPHLHGRRTLSRSDRDSPRPGGCAATRHLIPFAVGRNRRCDAGLPDSGLMLRPPAAAAWIGLLSVLLTGIVPSTSSAQPHACRGRSPVGTDLSQRTRHCVPACRQSPTTTQDRRASLGMTSPAVPHQLRDASVQSVISGVALAPLRPRQLAGQRLSPRHTDDHHHFDDHLSSPDNSDHDKHTRTSDQYPGRRRRVASPHQHAGRRECPRVAPERRRMRLVERA